MHRTSDSGGVVRDSLKKHMGGLDNDGLLWKDARERSM
jgi:hypothetical protein